MVIYYARHLLNFLFAENFRPKRFTLKAFKRYWFTCRDLRLTLYKSQEDAKRGGEPVHVINLKGCEVTPEVNLAQCKFAIKLEVASAEGMTEMWIRCDTEEQYAKWMAACRLAAKGRSLADSSYETEVKNIAAFLKMQHPAPVPAISPSTLEIRQEDYVPPRFLKKFKGKVSRTAGSSRRVCVFPAIIYFALLFLRSSCREFWRLTQT